MKNKPEEKPLTIRLPGKLHTEFKAKAALENKTMAGIIIACIKKYVKD